MVHALHWYQTTRGYALTRAVNHFYLGVEATQLEEGVFLTGGAHWHVPSPRLRLVSFWHGAVVVSSGRGYLWWVVIHMQLPEYKEKKFCCFLFYGKTKTKTPNSRKKILKNTFS